MQVGHCDAVIKDLVLLYNKYPYVSVHLECLWGTSACHEYFRELLVSDRSGREGFSTNTFLTILTLYLIHTKEYTDFGVPITLGADTNMKVEPVASPF